MNKFRIISGLLIVVALIGISVYFQIPINATEDLRLKNIFAVSDLEDGEKDSWAWVKERIINTKVIDLDIQQELQPDGTYKEVLMGYHILQITSCEGVGPIECHPDIDYDYWSVEGSSSDFNGLAGKKRQ